MRPVSRMPVLFVGHGSPMNIVEDNAFSRAWEKQAGELPRPVAILSISAHWETDGAAVTAMTEPRTIHDFYGFPPELYEKRYPALGLPGLAREAAGLVGGARMDMAWGLDHGTWSVLSRMYPEADVPVVQLGLDRSRTPREHYEMGRLLRPLRERGILILGSGNIVHNLGAADPSAGPYEWARNFDAEVEKLILKKDHSSLVRYEDLGEDAWLSIPTNEHYLPMLYALALREKEDRLRFFAEGLVLGSVSMRSFVLG